ncbi:hypothetical protein [Pseudomonas sp. On1]|uniref:hypothetical protein n=1 Tax=Pseudomonas sp. On1 TaxID=3083258 RepID=UPI0023504D9E|nr:hypothetical protein [Pseudomonas sp. On1]MDX2309767.1 hypothetical protein [Pseudomonas sp. On1]
MSTPQEMAWLTTISVPTVQAGERYVRLTGLPDNRKKDAWKTITNNHPGLADLLRSPELKEVVAFFDADIYVDAEVVPALPAEPLKGRKQAVP